MNKEERLKISEAAGCKYTWSIYRSWPFIHKEKWVFGGICGLCGKWNWQWCLSIEGTIFDRVTGPCEECRK